LHPDRGESRVLDQGHRPVEEIDGSDSKGAFTRSGPGKRGLAIEIEGHDLSAGGEVGATADHVFPSPAVEPVILEAGDDPVVSDEPQTR
jgi:hypothetical protein